MRRIRAYLESMRFGRCLVCLGDIEKRARGDGVMGRVQVRLVRVVCAVGFAKRVRRMPRGGNVYEWTLDTSISYTNPCNDCGKIASGAFRVVRGGNWVANASARLSSLRYGFTPSDRYVDFGLGAPEIPDTSVHPAHPSTPSVRDATLLPNMHDVVDQYMTSPRHVRSICKLRSLHLQTIAAHEWLCSVGGAGLHG